MKYDDHDGDDTTYGENYDYENIQIVFHQLI